MKANITLAELRNSQSIIGTFNNNFRRRRVTLFTHDRKDTVYSVGEPFDGGEPVICEEAKSFYTRQILDNDWTDYN